MAGNTRLHGGLSYKMLPAKHEDSTFLGKKLHSFDTRYITVLAGTACQTVQ